MMLSPSPVFDFPICKVGCLPLQNRKRILRCVVVGKEIKSELL